MTVRKLCGLVVVKRKYHGLSDRSLLPGYYQRWRRALKYSLNSAGIKRVRPLLEAEACSLCHKLLDDGADYKDCLRRWSIATPLVATSGRRLDDMPPGYTDKFFQSQHDALQLIIPGAAPLVDAFPILKYVPELLAGWKTEARRIRRVLTDQGLGILDDGRKQYARMRDEPNLVCFESMVAKIMREQDLPEKTRPDRRFTDLEVGHIGRDLIAGAVDTTSATFTSLMCCFAAFPNVLRKAQEEVDRVAGDRPPTGEHVSELVYLKACLSEVSIDSSYKGLGS